MRTVQPTKCLVPMQKTKDKFGLVNLVKALSKFPLVLPVLALQGNNVGVCTK